MRDSGHSLAIAIALLLVTLAVPLPSAAQFDSGSNGENGPFPPAGMPGGTTSILFDLVNGQVTFFPSNEVVELPNVPPGGFTDGVVNFTTFTVPGSVFLRFGGNVPPDIRAQGDVNVDGTIDLDGGDGGTVGNGGGGLGGIGGFTGGQGGTVSLPGGVGLGPGGGGGAGGGGSHGTQGGTSGIQGGMAGPVYGSPLLRPLVGGSGGGGHYSLNAETPIGPGGGGGGGAIGIASSTKIVVAGDIQARGGSGGVGPQNNYFGGGGGGGGIRLIANQILGSGSLSARRGSGSPSGLSVGGEGRVRLEAFDLQYSGAVEGLRSNGAPGPIVFANAPVIRVLTVGGVSVPEHPGGGSGAGDILVSTPGVKEVQVETRNIPTSTTISVVAKTASGNPQSIGPQTGTVPAGADPRVLSVSLNFPTTGLYFVEAETTVGP